MSLKRKRNRIGERKMEDRERDERDDGKRDEIGKVDGRDKITGI